jgi:anti-sigma factor ChrR (cupin superfamily)
MTAPPSKFLDTDAMEWRAFDEAPGVTFKVLKTHKAVGASGMGVTLLLRFAAGAAYPAHRHPEGEEYYVLDGELVDAGRAYGAGTFVYHPPMSVHRPSSTTGATVLVFLRAAIELV